MLTPWGEKITPENVWREHPRPQMVRDHWKNWAVLNGLWDYAVTAHTDGRPEKWDGKILVPFAIESPLSGVGRLLEPTEQLWYRCHIRQKRPKKDRIILHFGAVDYRAQIFVNGIEAMDAPHVGGNLPFSVDITELLTNNELSELVVAVWDPTTKADIAVAKQHLEPHGCMYTRSSGIWQTVWLEQVPDTYITGYHVNANPDTGEVEVSVKTSRGCPSAAVVEIWEDGKKLKSVSVDCFNGKAGLKIDPPKLWSPDSPNLYDLRICTMVRKPAVRKRYPNGIQSEDFVIGYFAFRKIEIRDGTGGHLRLFLNGKETFMFGTLDQGWWPDGLLTPPSDEAMEHDIKLLKEHGCNMMRKHIKIEPLRYYYLCDKLGILLWQDMPSGWGDTDARYAAYRAELAGMIELLRGIPSIVAWVPYNEAWGQPGAAKTNDTLRWVRRADPTRLVDGPSGWTDYGVGDMKDRHNYPDPMMPENPGPARVSVLGEFGGIGLAIPGHLWKKTDALEGDKKNWGYVSDDNVGASLTRLKKLFADLKLLIPHGLAAAVYTQTTDVEIEINGFATYDRKVVKYPAAEIREIVEGLAK